MGDELLEAARRGIERAGENEAEVFVRRTHRGLARFAGNVVGQHVDLREVEVTARVARGGRVALATGTDLDADAIARVVTSAAALCELVPPVEGFPGFAPAEPLAAEPPPPRPATRDATPDTRADLLAPELSRAAERGLSLSGTLETQVSDAAAATTAGQAVHATWARASARLFARAPDGASGFGGALDADLDCVDVRALAARAMERCLAARDPKPLSPGTYDVVLEPPAVAELMEWLSMIGFGAREVSQGVSFLAGREGERMTGEHIAFTDDAPALAARGIGMPFDWEGTPSKRVPLIDAGVAKGPVYDRLYGARAGHVSTGHASVTENGEMAPVAAALHLGTGDESDEQLVAGLDRGLLISRFHYVNGMLEPRRALMTGMTRDGTYWVENGKPVHAVKNLRFTDAILEALGRMDGLGAVAAAVPTWWSDGGAMVTPAVRIRGFRFTGAAEAET